MSSGSDVPIAMCLTQFHCLVMYRDRLEAVCVLNEKVVFQESHSVRVSSEYLPVCVHVRVCVRVCAHTYYTIIYDIQHNTLLIS